MGTIKDNIDLTTQHSKSVKDRKLATEISQIQSLISTIQIENSSLVSENLELKQKIFELEKEIHNLKDKHAKEESRLIEKHAKEISTLKEKLSAGKLQDKYTFNSTYGFYESKESGHPFCASCLPKNIESPLTVKPSGWRCELNDCKKFISNPSFKMQKRETPRYFKRR